jgi:hypothetical protein
LNGRSDIEEARAVQAVVEAFCEAYARRDSAALRSLVLPAGLEARDGLGGFIEDCVDRNQAIRPLEGGGLSSDGLRAAGSVTVGPPGAAGGPPQRQRPVRILVARDVDGSWKGLGATTEPGLVSAYLAGMWDGLSSFADLPLSAPLIRKGQRLADALMGGLSLEGLITAAGDPRADARLSLAMLAGAVHGNQRVSALPCRAHPTANRGAIGLRLEDPVTHATDDFWLICRTEGPTRPARGGPPTHADFAILGTAAHMSMGLLLGPVGGEDAARRDVDAVDSAAAGPRPDAFEQAIARALTSAVGPGGTPSFGASDAPGDAFDRAVADRMATDGDARARFQALFDLLAEDRRDATLRALLSGEASDALARGDGSSLAPLEALFRDGTLVATVRAALGAYVSPLVSAEGALNVDADFLATHGEALVGAALKAVMGPVVQALGPDALLGGPLP